jgi:hypothetical protein
VRINPGARRLRRQQGIGNPPYGYPGSDTWLPSHELAVKLYHVIERKRKKIPFRNKMQIDASVRSYMQGYKRNISKKRFQEVLKAEYNNMKLNVMLSSWGEKRALKQYIENTMTKMYNIV